MTFDLQDQPYPMCFLQTVKAFCYYAALVYSPGYFQVKIQVYNKNL